MLRLYNNYVDCKLVARNVIISMLNLLLLKKKNIFVDYFRNSQSNDNALMTVL